MLSPLLAASSQMLAAAAAAAAAASAGQDRKQEPVSPPHRQPPPIPILQPPKPQPPPPPPPMIPPPVIAAPNAADILAEHKVGDSMQHLDFYRVSHHLFDLVWIDFYFRPNLLGPMKVRPNGLSSWARLVGHTNQKKSTQVREVMVHPVWLFC